jgi:hypothetical protein
MAHSKKYWELSQESTLTEHLLHHMKSANTRAPPIPAPVVSSQESAAVIVM